MAIGEDLLAIPDMTLKAPPSHFQSPMATIGKQLTAGHLGLSPLASTPLPQDEDMALEMMAEQMASEKRAPPDWGMLANAIAGALPGSGQALPTPAGGGGTLGNAPQFQMQVNPFTATPQTGTTNPNLGNLLKGIAN